MCTLRAPLCSYNHIIILPVYILLFINFSNTINGCIISVRGQAIICRASVNCTGGPGDDLGMAVDGRSCCLDNPRALAYSLQDSEKCIACVGESQMMKSQ